ncbi:hypothetical protein SKAU_G00025290 [Synaphobranchus kaupii]|uniref:Uncharacterized protein n=1 Tax=Synaphobranchus kaupii TaxID=118154 RepID=A0A9Q1GCK2_SYNKA|nr:hypothetical protein SKAU_G00025290 [Synaphobranchus kaupii]
MQSSNGGQRIAQISTDYAAEPTTVPDQDCPSCQGVRVEWSTLGRVRGLLWIRFIYEAGQGFPSGARLFRRAVSPISRPRRFSAAQAAANLRATRDAAALLSGGGGGAGALRGALNAICTAAALPRGRDYTAPLNGEAGTADRIRRHSNRGDPPQPAPAKPMRQLRDAACLARANSCLAPLQLCPDTRHTRALHLAPRRPASVIRGDSPCPDTAGKFRRGPRTPCSSQAPSSGSLGGGASSEPPSPPRQGSQTRHYGHDHR